MNPPLVPLVLAIDPGRDKCGVALVMHEGQSEKILWRRVVSVGQMGEVIEDLSQRWSFSQVVLGDSTASAQWRAKIEEWLPEVEISLINESHSTYEARALYWQTHPPHGWRRLLPLSLQEPPEPIDDFAAVILARRFWEIFKGTTCEET
jgi:RNase H-fold protein (predicted Holliday junction resolvase)